MISEWFIKKLSEKKVLVFFVKRKFSKFWKITYLYPDPFFSVRIHDPDPIKIKWILSTDTNP